MFLVVRKKKVIAAIVLIAILITGAALALHGTLTAQAGNKLLPIYGVENEEGKVGLSFDAAWGADKTEQILDLLDEYGMKATFFLVGFWVDKYPDLVKEIYDRGHLVANHSTNHPHFNELSESDMLLPCAVRRIQRLPYKTVAGKGYKMYSVDGGQSGLERAFREGNSREDTQQGAIGVDNPLPQ